MQTIYDHPRPPTLASARLQATQTDEHHIHSAAENTHSNNEAVIHPGSQHGSSGTCASSGCCSSSCCRKAREGRRKLWSGSMKELLYPALRSVPALLTVLVLATQLQSQQSSSQIANLQLLDQQAISDKLYQANTAQGTHLGALTPDGQNVIGQDGSILATLSGYSAFVKQNLQPLSVLSNTGAFRQHIEEVTTNPGVQADIRHVPDVPADYSVPSNARKLKGNVLMPPSNPPKEMHLRDTKLLISHMSKPMMQTGCCKSGGAAGLGKTTAFAWRH